MMDNKELQEAIIIKNDLLSIQSKRIALLEEKMTELRKNYFQLKYAGLNALRQFQPVT